MWGRGALDTKCTLTAAMEAADGLIAQGFVPLNDIYLCFSGDEEIMGPTAEAILSTLAGWGVQPAFVLDEGGGVVSDALPGLRLPCALVGTGEKGLAELTVTATAKPGHAAMPPRHTAVGRLAAAVRRMERWPWPLRYTPPVRQLMEGAGRHARLPWRMVYANLGPLRPFISLWAALRGGEINALLRTTCAFTALSGSPAVNVLPDRASATASVRILPGENSKSVRRRAERLLRGLGVEIACRAVSEPSPPSLTETAPGRCYRGCPAGMAGGADCALPVPPPVRTPDTTIVCRMSTASAPWRGPKRSAPSCTATMSASASNLWLKCSPFTRC